MTKAITRRDTVAPAGPEGGRSEKGRQQRREFLSFGLSDELFALPLQAVREIMKVIPITEVPRAQPHILGILSVRGRITTVIDLRRRLRMPDVEVSKSSRILLVDGGDEVIGLKVDEVFQVIRLKEEEIELATVVAGDFSEYVLGIGRPGTGASDEPGEDILILLDPEPLLRR